jgi:Zn finger protein HypA/HybF involved in hydrogenase expression
MHDTIAAMDIISQAKKHGKVKKIVVQVGDLSPIKADDIESILKKKVDWDIEIVEKPAEVKCVCGYQGEPKIMERTHDMVMYCCPKCGLIPEHAKGNKIILKKVVLQ